jgi:hypothetical protein
MSQPRRNPRPAKATPSTCVICGHARMVEPRRVSELDDAPTVDACLGCLTVFRIGLAALRHLR